MGFSGNKFFSCVTGIARRKKKKRIMMMCNGESALIFLKKEVLPFDHRCFVNPRLFLSFHRLKVEDDNVGTEHCILGKLTNTLAFLSGSSNFRRKERRLITE
ncbi:hypothetical protein HAX54_004774, partial [Datura stramonium]|nr:hypothetical protein [Datura stramonium]